MNQVSFTVVYAKKNVYNLSYVVKGKEYDLSTYGMSCVCIPIYL